jgi:hypothetical protein
MLSEAFGAREALRFRAVCWAWGVAATTQSALQPDGTIYREVDSWFDAHLEEGRSELPLGRELIKLFAK